MTRILLTLLLFIACYFILFVLLLKFFNRTVRTMKRRNKQLTRRLYLKEIPFIFNYQAFRRSRSIGQFLGIVLLTAIIAFTVFDNIIPFGATVKYYLSANTKSMTQLGPKNRVSSYSLGGQTVTKISDDIVYFSTIMPFNFDTATVKVYFKNSTPDQVFSVGFQDQSEWHYFEIPYDAQFLNSLKWTKNGDNPTLYQRQQKYTSVDSFVHNPPHNVIIGTFNYDTDIGDPSQTHLSNYKAQNKETVINTPLRGRQVIYAYLENEPFHMTIEKQELNWHATPDNTVISVYKNNQMVYQTTAKDDGITDGSRRVKQPIFTTIDNPGPGLPENGVYKIVIEANSDTIIKSIKTNLHKIVFANTIFPAANSQVYGPVITTTYPTTAYTNALSLTASAVHNSGEQEIFVGKQSFYLNKVQIPVTIKPPDPLTKIVIPQNDVILNAFQGYFAFSPDQFFMPSNYYVMPVTTKDDVSMVDYVLTNYLPSHEENGWQVNEQTFDLSNAYVNNNRLSWVIEAPKLKENKGSLIIKDIQITFRKKGWL